jgi:hypothetical protein
MHDLHSIPTRRAWRRSLVAILALAAACDGGSTEPQPAIIDSVTPADVMLYSADFILSVHGSGFRKDAVVRWNGSGRPTKWSGEYALTAEITNADVQSTGTVQVTVSDGSGGTSNSKTVTVKAPPPLVNSSSPERVVRATGAFTLRLFGTGFAKSSVARWNGSDRPTTFVHPGELTVQISNADIQQAGMMQVTVFTPAPGGGTFTHSFPVD